MKTTIKLLIGLLVLVTGILSMTNYQLAQKYAAIDTADQYHEFEQYDQLNFDKIEINGGNELKLQIKQGEANSLFIHKRFTDKIDFTNKGGQLQVNFHEDLTDDDYNPREHDHYRNSPRVIITYTELDEITSTNGNMDVQAVINNNLTLLSKGNSTINLNITEIKGGKLSVTGTDNTLINILEDSERGSLNLAKFVLKDKAYLKIPALKSDSVSLNMSPESEISCGSSFIANLK